jgi:hypothetical protein
MLIDVTLTIGRLFVAENMFLRVGDALVCVW